MSSPMDFSSSSIRAPLSSTACPMQRLTSDQLAGCGSLTDSQQTASQRTCNATRPSLMGRWALTSLDDGIRHVLESLLLHVCKFNCQFNSKLNCRPVRPTTHEHKNAHARHSTVILAETRTKAKMKQNKHGTACNPAVIHSDHHLLQQILHKDCEILCVLWHILLSFSRHRLNFSTKKKKNVKKNVRRSQGMQHTGNTLVVGTKSIRGVSSAVFS